MPKESPIFFIKVAGYYDKFIQKLSSSKLIFGENLINLSEGSNYCLITEGTLLHSTYETSDNSNFIFKLFFKDIEISSTTGMISDFSTLETLVTNLDILPKSLLKSTEILEQEKLNEENTPDILLPLGNRKPEDLEIALLKYFQVTIHFDEKEKQFLIKLPKKQGFSYKKKYNFQGLTTATHFLKLNDKIFASIMEYVCLNNYQFRLDVQVLEEHLQNASKATPPATTSCHITTIDSVSHNPSVEHKKSNELEEKPRAKMKNG